MVWRLLSSWKNWKKLIQTCWKRQWKMLYPRNVRKRAPCVTSTKSRGGVTSLPKFGCQSTRAWLSFKRRRSIRSNDFSEECNSKFVEIIIIPVRIIMIGKSIVTEEEDAEISRDMIEGVPNEKKSKWSSRFSIFTFWFYHFTGEFQINVELQIHSTAFWQKSQPSQKRGAQD